MSVSLVQLLTGIADAIREKKLTTDKINAQNLAFEIKSIEPPLDTIELQQAGTYDVKDYKYAEVLPSELEAEYIKVIEGTATEIHIPEGTTHLRYNAFEAVEGLTVYIPTSLTSTETGPFQDMSSKKYPQTIKYAGTLQEWFARGLAMTSSGGYYFYENNETLITKIEGITEFNGVGAGTQWTSPIGSMKVDYIFVPNNSIVTNGAFASVKPQKIVFEGTINTENSSETRLPLYLFSWANCETIVLPTNITSIQQNVFYYCTLEELTIPEGVTTLKSNSFNGAKIRNIILPSTLTTIEVTKGITAYEYNTKVVINATTPPTATGVPFHSSYYPSVIYIPAGTLTAYQTATNWSRYADYFVEMNEVALNVQAEIVNNETYQYSLDGGVTWSLFASETINLSEIALIKFKNTSETTKLLIGKTAGASDVGSIADAELTYATEGSMTLYLRLEEVTE